MKRDLPGWLVIAVAGTLGLLLAGQAMAHEGVRRMKQVPLANLQLHPCALGCFLVDLPEGDPCNPRLHLDMTTGPMVPRTPA